MISQLKYRRKRSEVPVIRNLIFIRATKQTAWEDNSQDPRRWEVQLPDGNKVPVDRNDFSFTNGTEKVVCDFAYITIHGTPGEDGRLQGYFDMMRTPKAFKY